MLEKECVQERIYKCLGVKLFELIFLAYEEKK